MKVLIIATLFVAAAFGKTVPATETVEIGSYGEVSSAVASPLVSLEVNNPHGIKNAVSIEKAPTDTSFVVTPVAIAPEYEMEQPAIEAPAPSPVIADPAAPGIIGPGFEVDHPSNPAPGFPLFPSFPSFPSLPSFPLFPGGADPILVGNPIVSPPSGVAPGPAVIDDVSLPVNPVVVDHISLPVSPVVVDTLPETPAVVDAPVPSPVIADPAAPGIIGPGFEVDHPSNPAPGFPSFPSFPSLPSFPTFPVGADPVLVGNPIVSPPSGVAPGPAVVDDVSLPVNPVVVEDISLPVSPVVVDALPETPVIVDAPVVPGPAEAPVAVSPVIVAEDNANEAAPSNPTVVNNFFVNIYNYFNGKTPVSSFTLPSLSNLFSIRPRHAIV